jgi:hypothetical protein
MAGESFDPYDLATQGQNSLSPFTLSIQGQITDIFVEDIIVPEPIVPVLLAGGGGGYIPPEYIDEDKKRKLKKITVRCIIDGKEYVDSAYTTDLTVTAKDVLVKINESISTPKIIIEIIGK